MGNGEQKEFNKMKIILAALAFASVSAYQAPTMASKGSKKGKTKSAASVVRSPSADAWARGSPSQALPFTVAPATLDGSMLGDVGFDPFGFSTVPVGPWFKGIGDERMGKM